MNRSKIVNSVSNGSKTGLLLTEHYLNRDSSSLCSDVPGADAVLILEPLKVHVKVKVVKN